MIDVTEAIKRARGYAADLLKGEDYENIKLEEVVFSEESNEWHITLGYDSYVVKPTKRGAFSLSGSSPISSHNIFFNDNEQETLRTYKKFRIGAEDGSFKGMLIREVG
jgi:hypothetical protein